MACAIRARRRDDRSLDDSARCRAIRVALREPARRLYASTRSLSTIARDDHHARSARLRSPLRLAAALLLALARRRPGAQHVAVERGEYLARAGDCISCHTATGGAPFAGGLRLDTPFGYMLSPNITPDPDTGIGRWSSADFYRALHDGVNKRGQDMYPTMPYDFYTRGHARGRRRHLRLPAHGQAGAQRGRRQSPRLSVQRAHGRWACGASSISTKARIGPIRRKTASWNRGAYLVEGLGHCSDCHSPRNLMGGIEKSKAFHRRLIDGWFALDLTSDIATGLGAWSVDELATYFKTGVAKDKTTTLGPMAEVIRNSLSYLTDDDRRRWPST